ncbi:MAG: hypothetical protein C0483_02100 [Pirellula sp.]|nr:hypothetical protein [Pirellula sp.]
MAVDTPAKIAIIGAGPVGLEAAVYARFLGYDVDLYECGRTVEGLQQAAHVRSLEPWSSVTTPLGRASIANQNPQWRPADDDALLTYGELAERYFLPLAACDLLADCLQENNFVHSLGREGLLRGDYLQDDRRIDVPFRLIIGDAEGNQRVEHADVVFDCSGSAGAHCNEGNGGLATLGNRALRGDELGLPDLLGTQRSEFAGKHTLALGDGLDAARAVVQLAQLAAENSQTRITWVTRSMPNDSAGGPIVELANDPLPARAELARRANELAAQPGGILDFWPATHIEAIDQTGDAGPIEVEFSGLHAGRATFDRIIADVVRRPDGLLWREMQMLVCPATEAPLPMADFLRRQALEPLSDSAALRRALAQALLNPEPDFYVLGAKSYGRRGDFLLSHGHEQIVALFTIIGDREGLDLYASRFATQ